jgi:hypothetical protein
MDSLEFVVLFSVVMVAWGSRVAPWCVSVLQMVEKRVWGGEQLVVGNHWCPLSPERVAVLDKAVRLRRFCRDRRMTSGRGRPPLHLN